MWFFFLLIHTVCERSAKRDMGHIHCLTIELDHAKRDSRLTAYGCVVLQPLERALYGNATALPVKFNSAYIL